MSEEANAELAAALRARHADTLGGSLESLEVITPRPVEIWVSGASARTRAGQLLVLHLANLLGRLEGVVDTVSICTGEGEEITLLSGVDPRHPFGAASLAQAALRAAAMTAPHRARRERRGESGAIRVAIGSGADADVYTAASEWTAYLGNAPGPECSPAAALPFGAHAAAAIAAGEVFRMVRARGDLAARVSALYFSTWSWTAVANLDAGERHGLVAGMPLPPFTLVGVGAVGCAFLLTLWCAGLALSVAVIIDGDPVSTTNLNRYVLFDLGDVGRPKASRAADLLARGVDSPFLLSPEDCWWADYQRSHPEPIELLISATDKNTPRHALQDALPRVMYGGSTRELRAEVNRYDLAVLGSRCLKCHNAPEPVETDRDLHVRLLLLDRDGLRQEAEDRGVDSELLRRYVEELRAGGMGCAILAGPALEKLRHTAGEGEFAVSFVSALAGTLLAAQVIREASGAPPLLREPKPRGHFQLWRPAATANAPKHTPVEEGCWCTQPEVRAAFAEIWSSGTAGP